MSDLIGSNPQESATNGSGTRSVWCSNEEWAVWTAIATASGKSLSAWVRGWLNEAVRYDRLQLRDKAELERREAEAEQRRVERMASR